MMGRPWKNVQVEEVTMPGANGTKVRWLVSRQEGATNFYMRLFEVEPGGHTPYHSHTGEHEIFVLSGEGRLNGKPESHPLRAGVTAFVPEGEMHQFENTRDQVLRFLCIVPASH